MAVARNETPLSPDRAEAERKGRPPSGAAEDGRNGGILHRGKPGNPSDAGAGQGTNAQTGRPSGAEQERGAPGISTDKKADDTK